MSRPFFSVKFVETEALLPRNLTSGRAYFVADEKIIIIDHGDGRGPVRYGGVPGPQSIAGEPIPSLQGQIDELSEASIKTTLNIHSINMQNKTSFENLHRLIQDNLDILKSQNEESANAVLQLIVTAHNKFQDYDNAINILANALSKFYPGAYSGTSGDGTNSTPKGVFSAEDGNIYSIENAYTDGDTGVVVVTLYDNPVINSLKEDDTVQIDNGYFVVNSLSNNDSEGTISITLFAN